VKLLSSHENAAEFFENKKVGNEWLTSTEAARFLGVSPNALRILVCRGRVNYFKLGNRLRFCSRDLTALLREGA
jgi:excisionase family DNA binding protein